MKSFKQLFAECFYPLSENNNISAEYDAIFGDDLDNKDSTVSNKKYNVADDYNSIFGERDSKKVNNTKKRIIKFPKHLWEVISVTTKKAILKQYKILLTNYSNKIYPPIWEMLDQDDKEKIKDSQFENENKVHHNRTQHRIDTRLKSIATGKENNGNAYRRHKYY